MLMGKQKWALAPGPTRGRLAKMRSLPWLGQTAASMFWIGSMLTYGLESGGDWLQLCAASAWLLANIASFVTADAK